MSLPSDGAAQADRTNWRTAPFSQWAFRHVGEIIPTAPIPCDPAQAWPLPPASRGLDGFHLSTPKGPGLDLAGFMEATAGDALIVLRDGEVVHEAYANGSDAGTPHIIMSASKSVVGLIVGVLAEADSIDVDAPVTDYVPEVAGSAYRGATVRQLLDMRTGVLLDATDQAAYAAATNWEPAGDAPADLHGFYETFAAPQRPHGGPFSYISANTDLLGWVIERASGQSFAEVTSARLWRPLGAATDAAITVDDLGAPRTTGGICATALDLARLGQLLVQDGRRDGVQIVPSAWIDDIVANGDREAWKTGEFAAGFAGMTMRYRSGWYVVDNDPGYIFAMGIYGQNLFVDRTNRLVVAKLSSQASANDFRAIALTHRAFAEIRRLLVSS
jgi:CubicO group peptidase (beta-lactamase class C family)